MVFSSGLIVFNIIMRTPAKLLIDARKPVAVASYLFVFLDNIAYILVS